MILVSGRRAVNWSELIMSKRGCKEIPKKKFNQAFAAIMEMIPVSVASRVTSYAKSTNDL